MQLYEWWKGLAREKRFFLGVGATWISAIPYVVSLLFGEEGVRWIQNNPSFALFEFTFKAMAIGCFAYMFPGRDFEKAYESKKTRKWAGWLLVFLLVLVSLVVFADAFQARKERIVTPIEVMPPERKNLLDLDTRLRKEIGEVKKQLETESSQETTQEQYKLVTSSGTSQLVVVKVEQNDILKKKENSARDSYRKEARRVAAALFPEKEAWYVRLRNLIEHSSKAALCMTCLTLISAWFIAITFWYLLVIAFSQTKFTKQSFECLLLAFAFFIPWFPLRMYSEWYINYGTLDLQQYPAFYLAALFALVFLGLLFLLKTRSPLINTIVGGISGATVIAGVIAKFDAKMFDSIAWLINDIGGSGLGIAGVTVFLNLVLLACLFYYNKDVSKE